MMSMAEVPPVPQPLLITRHRVHIMTEYLNAHHIVLPVLSPLLLCSLLCLCMTIAGMVMNMTATIFMSIFLTVVSG